MNKAEYNYLVKSFGISDSIDTIIGESYCLEKIYKIDNHSFYYNGIGDVLIFNGEELVTKLNNPYDFIIFLTELTKSDIELTKHLLENYKRELFESINLGVSNDEWVKTHSEESEAYFDRINSEESEIDLKIRSLIKEYDHAVNPFMDEGFNLNDYSFNIDASSVDKTFRITVGKDLFDKLEIFKEKNGFSYNLQFKNEGRFFHFSHRYNEYSFFSDGKGECITYDYFDKEKDATESYKYNITKGKIAHNSNKYYEITDEDKVFIVCYLEYAITLANNIIRNSKNKVKKHQ